MNISDGKVVLNDDEYKALKMFLTLPNLSKGIAEDLYTDLFEKAEEDNLQVEDRRLLALYNKYNGNYGKVKEHIQTKKEDDPWVQEMSSVDLDVKYIKKTFASMLKEKLGLVESNNKYDAVYKGTEYSSAIGRYQVLGYTHWKTIKQEVGNIVNYTPSESTIRTLMGNPWISQNLRGDGTITMPDGINHPKKEVLRIFSYFLENPSIQERHFERHLARKGYDFVENMKEKYPKKQWNDLQLFYMYHHHGNCAEQFLRDGTTCKEISRKNSNANAELNRALRKLM